jgi:Helix-turn-helix domain
MTSLGRALVDSLDDADLDFLAERLAARIAAPADDWLDVRAAAAAAGCSIAEIRRAIRDGDLAHSQPRPGGKIYIQRSAIGRWRSA